MFRGAALRGSTALLSVAIAAACQKVSSVPLCPGSSGLIATKIRITRIDKIDLLVMVDNSPSMADQQFELARRIPLLVKALTNPDVDPSGKRTFEHAADLHVGVITSSLGSYGTSACDPANPHANDHGHLLKRPADGIPRFGWAQPTDGGDPISTPCPTEIADASALTWTNGRTPAGEFRGALGSEPMQVAASCLVESVQADGCGYANQLESTYHFLIDPDPWLDAKVDCTFGNDGDACGTNRINVTGRDDELLKERAAFLRPDSLLVVLMISNANDDSLKPAQLNWIPWAYAKGQMQRGWKACENVPDDFEPDTGADFGLLHDTHHCKSCFEDASDANCSVPWSIDPTKGDPDGRKTRVFHQVQRFGYNFYWGRQRYVDGFTKNLVPGLDASGNVVGKPNPFFGGGFRDASLVIVAGILGAPPDLVVQPLGENEWDKIASGDLTKRDSRMVESIFPRTGRPIYKGGGDLSADRPGAPTFGNGGERTVPDGDDLQYACIARRVIDTSESDCATDALAAQNPLCAPAKKQPYFKAYPSLRELRVLHGIGASGLVASICSDDYTAAMKALTERIHSALSSKCFKTLLITDSNGRVGCAMFESFVSDRVDGATRCESIATGYCTPGAEPCRVPDANLAPIDPDTAAAQLNLPITVVDATGAAMTSHCPAYSQNGNVYVGGTDDPLHASDQCGVTKHLVCEVRQINDDDACMNDPAFESDATKGGWCYSRNPSVVGDACSKIGAPATIRFGLATQPRDGSEVFIPCGNSIGGCGGASPLPPPATSVATEE